MKTKALWLGFLALAVVGLCFAGCSKDHDSITEPTSSQAQEDGLKAYPPYSISLNVPFLKQVPPGDWANTKNCGQTCLVMLGGYFNGTPVNSSRITAHNSWLAMYTGDSRYNQANGWYTSDTLLRDMLAQYHGLGSARYYGSTPQDVVNQLTYGRPCIVGVRISGGRLVSSGGVAHWALVVGWDGDIIVNDPGSSSGNHRRYSIATFDASWATSGRKYIPVWN